MELLFVTTYGICFALIAGGAFAMMWSNIKSINEEAKKPPRFSHPEAPQPGDEVMYVDVSSLNGDDFNKQKQALEDLYND